MQSQPQTLPQHNTAIANLWMVTREYGSLAGAGGVKDVSKHLAEALARRGVKVSVVLPCYGFMDPKKLGFAPLGFTFDIDLPYVAEERREFASIWRRQDEATLYLVDSPRFREKTGVYAHTAEDEARNPNLHQGAGHFDFFAMNVLLQKAAMDLMVRLNERPDIIHCHDGHTAILPAMIREKEGYRQYFHRTGCVVTIHNAGHGYHQEVGDLPFAQAITGLPPRVIHENLLDGRFDPFLAAAPYAVMNTVSENYARELRETYDDEMTGWLGHRLAARGITLHGITNGIDPAEYSMDDPARLGIAAPVVPGEKKSRGRLTGKERNKRDLVRAIAARDLGPARVRVDGTLDDRPGLPLVTFVGRLSAQKGVDTMLGALMSLLPKDPGFQVLVLGTGERVLEDALLRLAGDRQFHGRVCLFRGYDPILANRVYAAGDFLLIPSRYEPCGLTDLIAQLFANLPVVHHVGGLVKVRDGITGFAYQDHTDSALAEALHRAFALFREDPDTILAMQKNAVQTIEARHTWDRVVLHYLDLYEEAARLAQRFFL